MYGIAGNLEVGSLESILGKWNLMRDGTGISAHHDGRAGSRVRFLLRQAQQPVSRFKIQVPSL